MDSKTWLSSLGESRVVSELIRQGYDVFTQLSGKSPVDLIAYKDGKLSRVQVKSTGTQTKYKTGWAVQLKTVRSNKTANKITNFDPSSCDMLGIYIEPEDRVVLVESSSVTTKTELIVKLGSASQLEMAPGLNPDEASKALRSSTLLASASFEMVGDCCATCLNCLGGGINTIGCVCNNPKLSMCYSTIQEARKKTSGA